MTSEEVVQPIMLDKESVPGLKVVTSDRRNIVLTGSLPTVNMRRGIQLSMFIDPDASLSLPGALSLLCGEDFHVNRMQVYWLYHLADKIQTTCSRRLQQNVYF